MNIIIGVVGAGVMGAGVAQKFAQYGYSVILIDLYEEVLQKALSNIERSIMLHNMMNQDKIDKVEVMNRIKVSVDYACLSDVNVIVENIPEVISEKLEVYKHLDQVCKKECIYMVNTSCIPITMIGQGTNREGQVIGVHFMNPVPMQHFAEVIRGKNTLIETEEKTIAILQTVGIESTVINDSPGFVSNRLSHLFMNEAANLVLEGVATVEQIDQIFMEGFHHKMGPLQTADLIGLDTVKNSLDVLYEFYKSQKYKCSPYLSNLVEKNYLGRKNGKGFYEY